MHVERWCLVEGLVMSSGSALGKPTDAEKAKQKAEKKLEAFQKEYDPSKNLARKGDELPKDIEALDKELDALTALDAAAGAELKARRDAAVAAAQQAVGGAAASKAIDALEKKLDKVAKDFDPEKKKLDSIDPKALERARKEVDELLEKVDAAQRPTWTTKRDELFAKIEGGVGDAKVARRRAKIEPVPPVEALPGVEAIRPQKPTWCEGVLEARGKALDTYFPPVPRTFSGRLTEVLAFSCLDPDWDVRQQIVAAWRQQVSNTLGLDAATNERLLKLAAKMEVATLDKTAKALEKAHCTTLTPVSEGTAAARANRALERTVLGCGNSRSDENRMRLIDIDAPGALTSQLAAAGVISAVLGENMEDPGSLLGASDVAVASTLTLDPAAFEAQLSALKLNPFGEATALVAFYGQRQRLARLAQTVRDAAKKTPALTKLVFDAPGAAARDYVAKRAAADRPLLDLVLAMEAQPGNLDGCSKKLWPFFVAELKGQSKASLEAVSLSGLLAWAMTECARRDGEVPGMEAVFSYWAERTTAVRGPLTAAYLAYVDAYNELSAGQAKQVFDPDKRTAAVGGDGGLPKPRRNPMGEAALSDSRFGHENALNPSQARSGGVVKAVEKKGDVATLTFRTEKFMVPDYQCVETNRIDRITADGQLIYRQQCTKTGEHEEESTLSPTQVPAWTVNGIGPGSYVVPLWASTNGGAAGHGFILEAFDSKARGKRTSLLGVPP
ncbi:MAG: hypothetical protein SFW67_06905 [Myxococcaceae bacterium]|nr:hypothetical protein [Myxococcaceae bacterium]